MNLGYIRDRIRVRLRDQDDKFPTYSGVEVDIAIADAYLALQAQLPAPHLYTASAFTISAGGDTFTLPATVTQWTGNDGGAEYAGDVRIRLQSTGLFLIPMTVGEIDAYRNGTPDASIHLNRPYSFCLWEEKDQDVQGRCYPGAQAAEACDLFRTLSADDLRDFVGAGTDDMDDVEVQFSRIAGQALVAYVAADLLERMPESELEKRRMSSAVIPSWRREAGKLLWQEGARQKSLLEVGRIQRWIS